MAAAGLTAYRQRIQATVHGLAEQLRERRNCGSPASSDEIRQLVKGAFELCRALKRGEATEDNRSRADAVYPADESALAHMQDALDLLLAAYEEGYTEETLPLSVLAALLEVRPISACEPIVAYIESRVGPLTKAMEYQRGRGPILLRLLNDLLRRLPRSQSQSVILSGRILMLLSSAYPLGEKSGVNLRGNFNIGKGTVFEHEAEKEMEGAKEDAKKEDVKMEVEEGEEEELPKDAENQAESNPSQFYTTFWSLQRIFNNPPLLFAAHPAASTSTDADPFRTLQNGLRQTLAAFAAATKKEKELAGSAKEGVLSGKAEESEVNAEEKEGLEEYFFPKFLTSRNLLELELADANFRRQILVQMLILYQYLLSLTPAERARVQSFTPLNAAALSPFTLQAEHETWIREMRSRTLDELDSMEGGRRFRKAVQLVLQREHNWMDWKLRSCAPFTKPSLDAAAESDKARTKLRAATRKTKKFPYKMGNPNLNRTWQHNTTTLDGFEPNVADDELNYILREYRLEKNRAKQQEAQLACAAPGSSQRYEVEATLQQKRIRLQALHWRAIRAASTQHLRHFSSIGAGDVDKLQSLIDEERRQKEEKEEERLAEVEGKGPAADEPSPKKEYDSDTSVLGLNERKSPDVVKGKQAQDVKKPQEEAGTPEPEDAAKKTAAGGDDEPGTPPPKDVAMPGTPGTPKRPREEDVAMQDGEVGAKRQRVE
ncbi:THO complex subunit 1 [Rhodotorula toruloides]|uniref:THO complex subunit 1 n=1 Tax=Rhodotorula toruloides TaxID=5286 RepID=A0A511KKF1_RHOTO|nr:THO complex subunit 1 [Rhodotorula toruloides]